MADCSQTLQCGCAGKVALQMTILVTDLTVFALTYLLLLLLFPTRYGQKLNTTIIYNKILLTSVGLGKARFDAIDTLRAENQKPQSLIMEYY